MLHTVQAAKKTSEFQELLKQAEAAPQQEVEAVAQQLQALIHSTPVKPDFLKAIGEPCLSACTAAAGPDAQHAHQALLMVASESDAWTVHTSTPLQIFWGHGAQLAPAHLCSMLQRAS